LFYQQLVTLHQSPLLVFSNWLLMILQFATIWFCGCRRTSIIALLCFWFFFVFVVFVAILDEPTFVNVMTTAPFWVVNTRMKMQGAKIKHAGEEQAQPKYPKYDGILDGIIKIAQMEGASTLWSGMIPSLMLVSSPAIQFMVYESLKRRAHLIFKTEKLTAGTIFALGACSKSISTVITYPLQLVQAKARYGGDDVKNKRLIEIVLAIIKTNGPAGMYKGLEAKLLQTVLATALMYLCYEKITGLVFAIMKGKNAKLA